MKKYFFTALIAVALFAGGCSFMTGPSRPLPLPPAGMGFGHGPCMHVGPISAMEDGKDIRYTLDDCNNDGKVDIVRRYVDSGAYPEGVYYVVKNEAQARRWNLDYVKHFVVPVPKSDGTCSSGDYDKGTVLEDGGAVMDTGGAAVVVAVCDDPTYFVSDWYWAPGSYRTEAAQKLFDDHKAEGRVIP